MALQKIDLLGAPDYGRIKGVEGVVFHTPENASPSVEDAVATARWQAGSSNTSGGSYHFILGHDDSLGPMSDPSAWVAVKTVPFNHIAGSISTNRDPAVWQPGRYPWIEQLLSDAAYNDPNAYLHALCLSGKARWWSDKLSTRAGRDSVRGALIAMAKWIRRLEVMYDYDAILTLHRHWQTNRTDPDGLRFADLVLDEYEKLAVTPTPPPAEEPTGPTVPELQAQIAGLTDQLEVLQTQMDDASGTILNLRRQIRAKNTALDEIKAKAEEARS